MDFFAKLAGKRDEPASHPLFTDFESLLRTARVERQKLESVLSSVTGDAAAVPQALEQLEERASALTRQIESMSDRAGDLTKSAAALDALQSRTAALEETLRTAEDGARQSLERAEQVNQKDAALEELVSRAQAAASRLQSLVGDPHVLQIAEQLPAVRETCERVVEQQQSIAAQMTELQSAIAALTQNAASAGDLSKRADEQAAAAAERLGSLQCRLDEALQLQAVSSDTSAQLQTLNALAEHVSTKVKALENQHQTIERALVDSRRVGEMVWEMNVQIEKLREGSTLAASVEDTLRRLGRLHQEATGKLETAAHDRAQFSETVEQQRQKSVLILQTLQTQLDRLSVNRSELDTLAERQSALRTGLDETERRLAEFATREQMLAGLGEKLDGFAARAEKLGAEVDAIEKKQPLLDTLQARLDEVDGETRRATVQVESLTRRRQELVAIKSEFDAGEATYANVRKLADELQDQKHQFTAFVDQAREFMRDVPGLEAAVTRLTARVADTEVHAGRAISMTPRIDELAERLDQLAPRFEMADELRARLNTLHELSQEIDTRLAAQLARQADLDRIRVTCDGLTTHVTDAQQKLAALEAAQARLAALPEQVSTLEAQLADARQGIELVQQNQASIAAQDQHLAQIHESAGALLADISARIETLKNVEHELDRARVMKDDLYQHMTEILTIERETFERHHEAQSLLEQFSARWKQLDQRRAELGTVEQAMKAIEARVQTLDRLAEGVDGKISALGERERIVDAVKQEIDVIHEVARKCQENLTAIADQRAAIHEGRVDIDRLASALALTGEKLSEVERRTAAVDEVRRKADAVARLLDDVRVSLDTVGEQKAVVDHVTEMLARFEDAQTEARGTLRALQSERKLAQRIVETVRTIHARAAAEIRQEAN